MTIPRDTAWTAVTVRGKRNTYQAGKARYGARRKPELRKPQGISTYAPASPSMGSFSRRQKRKPRRNEELSRLEQLPAEVMQHIFAYSVNLALPLVSRELALKLSHSPHLHVQLTSLLLRPVLGHVDGSVVTSEELTSATRLLNSKFMTWDFFAAWLQGLPEAAELLNNPPTDSAAIEWERFWSALRPASGLLPPKKLLSPPFTSDKITFLGVIAQGVHDIGSISPAYEELAQEGLITAVEQGNALAVTLFFRMGLQSSTELLRIAVADAGCHEDIVRLIVERSRSGTSSIDMLDPVVWSWAEREIMTSNEKGHWLLEYLRQMRHSKYDHVRHE